MNNTDILLSPILSEKTNLLSSQNKYVFKVNVKSNKMQIKSAIENRFNVTVKKISTMIFKGKNKNFTIRSSGNVIRTNGNRSNWKKAIITLPEGQKIDLVEGDF